MIERELYRDACAVVTLTDLHAADVIDGAFGKKPADVVVTIPTCADYDEFRIHPNRPDKPTDSRVVPEVVQARLRGKRVAAIVGALNRSYAVDSTLEVARLFLKRSPNHHLLVLSEQRDAYAKLLGATGFGEESMTIAAAAHADMPAWMDWIDWSILLLPDVAAKRGSMPTKLAEFFASGVRVVAHGCNAEMANWVRRAGSGISLNALAPGDLADAAAAMSAARGSDDLHRARQITAPHFSLWAGLERYADLLRRVL